MDDLPVVRPDSSPRIMENKRGLPRAVRTDQPDAVLAVHLQRRVGEQHALAVCLADACQSQHVNHKVTMSVGENSSCPAVVKQSSMERPQKIHRKTLQNGSFGYITRNPKSL